MTVRPKVLWISHHWPPLMSTCANMAHAFVDHLALQGVEVFVLTPEIPGPVLPTVAPGVNVITTAPKGKVSFWRKMTALTKGDADWFEPALDSGRNLLKTNRQAGDSWAIIGSSGAKTVCFEVAALLSKEFSLPLVLDYRDPWTLNEAVDWRKWKYAKKIPKLFLARKKEARTLAQADWVLCRSEGLKADLQRSFPGKTKPDSLLTLPNAVDERLLTPFSNPVKDPSSVRLFFKGRGSGREPYLEKLVMATRSMAKTLDKPVDLHLLGMGSQYAGVTPNCRVQFQEGLPQEDMIRLLAAQDILVTIVPPEESGRETGTLWLYVASGKPILALAPPQGDEAKGVRLSSNHQVLPPQATEEELLQALKTLLQNSAPGEPLRVPQALAGTQMQLLKEKLEVSWGH